MSIKLWSADDRPVEKLIKFGASYLTNSELIAIILRSGSSKKSALGLAKELMATSNNCFDSLLSCSITDLIEFQGVGQIKAASIVAVLEISKRIKLVPKKESLIFNSSEEVYTFLRYHFFDLPHEEFWVLFLNNQNKLLKKELISKGGLSSTIVDVRITLKKALLLGAQALIICHNHPSESLLPSKEDKVITNRLKTAANFMQIELIDHIIFTNAGFFSFSDENLL